MAEGFSLYANLLNDIKLYISMAVWVIFSFGWLHVLLHVVFEILFNY